ncbi:Ensconsin Microtubule-associated protein 7 [Takifugu flavidus]|uniref:Ensconsin Microtubule-associated protein 7 n=1 Tax=Takifugu flavidus TaxID=433684 RepID=A0A5C6NTM5_9TELE|nr:Ensconsin Microtubule-associated protein 7 [Takifugu flavidus]
MPESKRREKRGGGGGCRRGKRSQRRGNSRSATPALFTITEEEEGQRRRGAYRSKKKASYYHYKSEDGRESSATHPSSAGSMQVYTPSTLNRTTASNSPSNNVAIKSDSLLFNRIDERLRLARERRGELEKQNAIKEAQWQAREERARQHYERQLEEKRKKLEEQRVKEDRRRAAVEEKRRQKLEEDKARHEAAIRRTVDRSQRAKQKPNRWSWGGSLQPGTPSTAAGFVESAFLYPLDLAGLEHMQSAFSLYRRYGMTSRYADRRSVSTTNLSKHADSVITKRLSVSSATLLHSPDRGLRRLPLTPWETNVVTRLQQPTHSYLARSRSAMSLSGDHAVSCQPMGSVSFKALQAQPLPHCRSQDRSLSRETVSSSSKNVRRRTTGSAQPKDRNDVRKSWSNLSLPLTPLLTLPPNKYLSPPGKRQNRATAPSPGRPPQKPTGRPPTPKLVGSPGAEDPGNLRPVKITPESPQQTRSLKEEQDEEKHTLSPPLPRPQPVGQNKPINEPAAATERVISPPSHKPSAGTTDPEEASRILAENRRLVREQREREEEERRQQEEQARLAKEEMARRKAEERAKREEEALRQAEELRKLREEEERRQEEERWKREREEVARLQKQKEEEESRQKEEAERLKQERERHFQKQEAERMERKKRLEEIMKRTRRSEPAEKKAAPNRNGDSPGNLKLPAFFSIYIIKNSHDSGCVSSAPTLHPSAVTVSSTSRHGDPDPNSSTVPSQPEQRENGEFGEVTALPSHSRLSPPEGEEQREQQGETVPVAFRENGLLKPLSGVEDISAQQGPGQ